MLFSVIILTYNSSKYVLDALESVKNQSYLGEVELIVSDDASTDDTVKICKKWLVENGHRFASSKVLEAAKNGGVAANCNRGRMASKGEWIKLLDGDDAILPEGLQVMADYIKDHPNAQVITAPRKVYRGQLTDSAFVCISDTQKESFTKYARENQLRMIADYNGSFPVADAIRSDVLLSMGGYDERYMFEDLSFAVRFIEGGGKYDYIPTPVVAYRKNSDSITGHKSNLFYYRYMRDYYRMNRDYLFRYASGSTRTKMRLEWGITWLFHHLGLNHNKKILFILYHGLINAIFTLTGYGRSKYEKNN